MHARPPPPPRYATNKRLNRERAGQLRELRSAFYTSRITGRLLLCLSTGDEHNPFFSPRCRCVANNLPPLPRLANVSQLERIVEENLHERGNSIIQSLMFSLREERMLSLSLSLPPSVSRDFSVCSEQRFNYTSRFDTSKARRS